MDNSLKEYVQRFTQVSENKSLLDEIKWQLPRFQPSSSCHTGARYCTGCQVREERENSRKLLSSGTLGGRRLIRWEGRLIFTTSNLKQHETGFNVKVEPKTNRMRRKKSPINRHTIHWWLMQMEKTIHTFFFLLVRERLGYAVWQGDGVEIAGWGRGHGLWEPLRIS